MGYSEKERKRIENAETVDYDGPFVIGEDLYEDTQAYLNSLRADEEPLEYGFVPETHRVYTFDTEQMVQDAMDRAKCDPDCDIEPSGYADLAEIIALFNEENRGIVVYAEGHKQKFRIEGTE